MMAGQSAFSGNVFPQAGFNQADEQHVLRPLSAGMGVSLMLNPDSQVWLLHDKPFSDILMWAEYDIDAASLTLVMRDGKIQELGLKIQMPVRKYLR